MRQVAVAIAMACAVALGVGSEVGVRFEVGDQERGMGWVQLFGEIDQVRLSGRIEGDLLCGCLRRAQVGASTTWGGLSAAGEAVVLGTGRADASASGSWKTVARTDLGLASAQLGGKATVADLLGGRFLTAAGWALGRLEADPWWIEASGNVAWPGGDRHAELRLGLAGPMWCTVSVTGSGTSLELGAGERGLSVQTSLSLRPPLQTIAVGLGKGGVRALVRLTVRAEGAPSASLTVTATETAWQGSVVVAFSGLSLDKVSAEVRYTVGARR